MVVGVCVGCGGVFGGIGVVCVGIVDWVVDWCVCYGGCGSVVVVVGIIGDFVGGVV